MPNPAVQALTFSDVETEADSTIEALMEAINAMYRAMHKVESLKDKASAGRAALRDARAG